MPLYQFVDEIDASPTVLLDLDDGSPLNVSDGTSTSPPRRRVSSYGSSARDGDVVAQRAYADRTIKIALDFRIGSTAEEQSEAIQNLGRLLDGPQWLLWQHEAKTEPVFYRTRFGEIEVDDSIMDDKPQRLVTLNITAEPFGYGERESGSVTISNDPTSGTNKMCATLPTIKGDVASPLVLDFLPDNLGSDILAATLAIKTAIAAPIYLAKPIASSPPTGWTYTSSYADATAVGGNCLRMQRASGVTTAGNGASIPALLVPEPGDYRLFARVFGGTGQTLSISQMGGGDAHEVAIDYPFAWQWYDCGVFRCPSSKPRVDSLMASTPFGNDYAKFQFEVTNPSVGDTRLSAWVLVPAGLDAALSDKLALVHVENWQATDTFRLDAISDAVYWWSSDPTASVTNEYNGYAGGLPVVVPGVDNQLWMAQLSAAITETLDVDWFYYPQYLYDRPAAS